MNQLTDVIRSSGNPNIILIPCAEQGQDESVLIKKGNLFLKGQQNILFDIHAYEKWLLVSNSEIERRLKLLQDHNLPFIFGEIAPINASLLMNPRFFLEKAYTLGTSICAWVWKYDGSDQNALLTEDGFPNDNNNNSWGTTYQSLSRRERMP